MTRGEKIDNIKRKNPFKIADIILFGILAAVIALLFYFLYRPSGAGELHAVVRIDGELYGSYPLSRDAEIDVDGKLTLMIVNGEAYVAEAKCPDLICVHSGRIRRVHEMVVCAPFGVTVRIDGGSGVRLPGAR